MRNLKYDKEITALVVIDPYNDFIFEGGKFWGRIKGVAEAKIQKLEGCREALKGFSYPLTAKGKSSHRNWRH